MGRRRIKKVFTGSTDNWTLVTEKRFVYKGFKQIAELDASDTIQRSYVWNGETPLTMTDSDGTFYYVTDNNKNVTMLIDSNDTVRATYEYSPFGKITAMTGDKADDNPIRFSSEYFDQETGLVYFNFRYYSPELGRWLSRDPIEEWGGINLYGMLGNDTVNQWDLWGLSACGYWWGVGQVFLGYGDAVVGIAQGIYQLGRHPINSIMGIGSAIANYDQTWDAIVSDYSDRTGSLRGQGSIVGEILITIGTVGYGASTSAGSKTSRIANLLKKITKKAPKSGVKLTGKIELHHLLPKAREFKKFFKGAGLDVEKFKIPLDKAIHRLKPSGLHTNAGGNWNKVWREFMKANPNATKKQILNQLNNMKKQSGL